MKKWNWVETTKLKDRIQKTKSLSNFWKTKTPLQVASKNFAPKISDKSQGIN